MNCFSRMAFSLPVFFFCLHAGFVFAQAMPAIASNTMNPMQKFHVGLVTGYEPSEDGIRVTLNTGFTGMLPASSGIPEALRRNTQLVLTPVAMNNGIALTIDVVTGQNTWYPARVCVNLASVYPIDTARDRPGRMNLQSSPGKRERGFSGLKIAIDPVPSYYYLHSQMQAYEHYAAIAKEAATGKFKVDVVYSESDGIENTITHIQRAICTE